MRGHPRIHGTVRGVQSQRLLFTFRFVRRAQQRVAESHGSVVPDVLGIGTTECERLGQRGDQCWRNGRAVGANHPDNATHSGAGEAGWAGRPAGADSGSRLAPEPVRSAITASRTASSIGKVLG